MSDQSNEPVPAATILLLRNGLNGLEVFRLSGTIRLTLLLGP